VGDEGKIDWKKAAKLGGIGFLGSFLAGIVMLFFAPATANAEQLGQGVGRFAGFTFIGGLCVSYMEQTGQKLFPKVLKILWGLTLAALILFAATYTAPELPAP